MNAHTTIQETANMPHHIEAEQQLLGALMCGFTGIDVIHTQGGADLFFDPVHQTIFKTCAGLAKNDQPITPVTVKAAFPTNHMDGLNELGGAAYLVRLAGASVSSSLAASYAEVLGEAKAKRNIMTTLNTALDELNAGDIPARDVATKVEAQLSVTETRGVKPISIMGAVTGALKASHAAHVGDKSGMVASGIPALDHFIDGFYPGDMWLLGGRPSMGKTGVALSIALNAARAGHPVIIASLEMIPDAIALRAMSEQVSHHGEVIAYTDIRGGKYSEMQQEKLLKAAEEVARLPIVFLSKEYADADMLQSGVRQALRSFGKTEKRPLIMVDYAQLMKSKAKTRYEQITDVSLALKDVAMKYQVPLVALSQLSRAVEQRDDKRPMMSDLRESGQLEQDADGVIFCYRDSYYIERSKPDNGDMDALADWHTAMECSHNRLELIVAKQRQGNIGTAHVMFNPAINKIWEA